jgi:ubiquinol-cytochrome c reductase cytochrome c1 subunit
MFSLTVGLIVAVVLLVVNIVFLRIPFIPKEFRILTIVVIMVGYVYWGFEPFAHHEMHPSVAEASHEFNGAGDIKIAQDKGQDTKALEEFWAKVALTSKLTGNAEVGKTLVMDNCTGCHAMEAEGVAKIMSDADSAATYGVATPDISIAGRIYDKNYLVALIMNPVKAMHIEHKFPEGGAKIFPMPASEWMAPQEIADMVAFMQETSKKVTSPKTKEGASEFEISKAFNKQVYEAACGRCHSMEYAGIESTSPAQTVSAYLGATPPDLSQYIRSRGEHFLHNFINDPQRKLAGTGMPRVGLNKASEDQVVEYMTQIGDSKKDEREALGPKVLIYLTILALFAILWKKQIWRDLH